MDDFSFRRGRIFGTILVDLEKHKVIDVLEDRDATSFATWLKAHPGVEIISRDRGQIYAQGATDGAPEAVQVADRWHLLQNLAEAVENWLRRHLKHLKDPAVNVQMPVIPVPTPVPVAVPDAIADVITEPKADREQAKPIGPRRNRTSRTNSYLKAYQNTAENRVKKLEVFEKAIQLREQGFSARSVARTLGKSRTSIGHWFTRGLPHRWRVKGIVPNRRVNPGRKWLLPHFEYVKQRIDVPEVATKQIYSELLGRGYEGSLSSVYALVARLRAGLFVDPASLNFISQARYSPREGVWMFVRKPEKLERGEPERLAELEREVPEAKTLYAMVQGFARLLRDRSLSSATALEAWIVEARACGIAEVRRFANGVVNDQAAVLAGMTLEWSNGQVEGQVTRLKLIKRFGFGRAKFDLLRARVLLA